MSIDNALSIHIAEVHIHFAPDSLGANITKIIQGILQMVQVIDELKTAVTAENGVIESAVVLINGISDRVAAAVTAALAANPGVDLTPLTDLTTSINQEASALASAVAANTPAAPVV